MIDPGIGINAYIDEIRRQRGSLGNDAAQMAADLAITRAERDQLQGLVTALEVRIAELTKEDPAP